MRVSKENEKLISSLIKYTSKVRGVDKKLLKTKKRHVVATNIALCGFIRNKMHLPFQTIGPFFKKHHATIIHYCNQHDYLIGVDKEYFNLYKLIEKYFDDYGIVQTTDKSSLKDETKIYLEKMEFLREENKLLSAELDKCRKQNKEKDQKIKRLSRFANW